MSDTPEWPRARSENKGDARLKTCVPLFALLAAMWAVEAPCADEDLSLSAACGQKEVGVGETVTVTVTAVWEGPDGGKYIVSAAAFPKLHNLELVSSQSAGEGAPSPQGTRFERKLSYLFRAKEAGEAETGPIEVRYYRPEVKHEKVASAADKKDAPAPLVRELPSIPINVLPRASAALLPLLALVCAGIGVLFLAFRLLRRPKNA